MLQLYRFSGLFLMFSIVAHTEPLPLQLPDSEIYLFQLEKQGETVHLSKGRNISRHPGYDNQPSFTANSRSLLFTSQRAPTQTDIYEYFIKGDQLRQLTETPEQEYSPKASPDNRHISFVREGGNPNQSLWYLQRSSGEIRWALNSLEPVGYYAWDYRSGDMLLWLRYAYSVQYVNPDKGVSYFVTGYALPSSPQLMPGSVEFSFIHRQMNDEVWIKAFNPQTRALRPLMPVKENSRDYAWMPDGKLLMGTGSRLYYWQVERATWGLLADVQGEGINHITRLAVSPDGHWLALVENALP